MPRNAKHQVSAETYLRFLRLSAPQKFGQDALSANELELFEEIVLAWSVSKPLSVMQAIGIKRLGVPATVFRRLKTLRKSNLLEAVNCGVDPRTKYLYPTKKGIAFMCHWATCMVKASEKTASTSPN